MKIESKILQMIKCDDEEMLNLALILLVETHGEELIKEYYTKKLEWHSGAALFDFDVCDYSGRINFKREFSFTFVFNGVTYQIFPLRSYRCCFL